MSDFNRFQQKLSIFSFNCQWKLRIAKEQTSLPSFYQNNINSKREFKILEILIVSSSHFKLIKKREQFFIFTCQNT